MAWAFASADIAGEETLDFAAGGASVARAAAIDAAGAGEPR